MYMCQILSKETREFLEINIQCPRLEIEFFRRIYMPFSHLIDLFYEG